MSHKPNRKTRVPSALAPKVVFVGLLTAVLVAVYIANPTFRWPINALGDSQPAPIPCASSDTSYCDILRRVVSGAVSGDYSLLLTVQQSITVECGKQADTHCPDNYYGSLQLYGIDENGQQHTLTHNEYIGFFRSLVEGSGSLRYTGDDCAHSRCSVTFVASHVHVLLPLQRTGGAWQLAEPSILKQKT